MFWSDTMTQTIHQANIDGDLDERILVDSDIIAVGRLRAVMNKSRISN